MSMIRLPFVHAIHRLTASTFLAVAFLSPLSCRTEAASSWDGKAPVEYIVSVEADKPDALYSKGEKVTFHIQLQQNQAPVQSGTVQWTISKDSVAPFQKGEIAVQNGKATVSGSLNEPGFLQCEVKFNTGKETIQALAGAGIDPLEIKPSMPAPDDFDEYWSEKKKALAAVPLNIKTTPAQLPAERQGVEAFDLQADCLGDAPVSGYYARPSGAKPKSCPAILFLHGAGVRSANLNSVAGWAQKGLIAMDINAHGIPNGKPQEFYDELNKGSLKDYRTRGCESRETIYFLGMYLRVLRAIDVLAAQPEWDGKILILQGGSQGGGQAIAGAALDPRVTYAQALIPALSDHTGMIAGRVAGWPKIVPKGSDGNPNPKAIEAARYYDNVNFAARIKAPIYMWVGFIDRVCPPSTVYAVYNNIKSPKEIYNDIPHGHDIGNVWSKLSDRILAYLQEARKQDVSSAQ